MTSRLELTYSQRVRPCYLVKKNDYFCKKSSSSSGCSAYFHRNAFDQNRTATTGIMTPGAANSMTRRKVETRPRTRHNDDNNIRAGRRSIRTRTHYVNCFVNLFFYFSSTRVMHFAYRQLIPPVAIGTCETGVTLLGRDTCVKR